MRLLHNDGKVLAIYFPPGLPERGGSCVFASMKCLVNCLTYLTHNDITAETFDAFKNRTEGELSASIWSQIKDKKPRLMEWFCWGDCPPELTQKVSSVMWGLSKNGAIQCGFTRNEELWKIALKIPNARIGITIEDIGSVDDYAKKGLVAYPIYDTGHTKLFYKTDKTKSSGMCGCTFMYDEAIQINYEADCQTCYENKRGCFTKFRLQPAGGGE